ncbi:MAG: hypothetical protein WA061_01405 [Microgenomates group bacterium]
MRNFGYSPMYYHSSFWPEGIIALLINVLVWGLVIYLIVHLVRKLSSGHGSCCGMHGEHGHSEEADDSVYLDIVKRRYAKGEINKKEYEELKMDFSEDQEKEPETPKE